MPTTCSPRSAVVVALLVACIVSSCGDSTGVWSGPSGPPPIELPADPNQPVVQIDEWLPVITADGHVYTDAREPTDSASASFQVPLPPAPQPVAVAQLTATGLQEVMLEAQRLGLIGAPPDYGDPKITDQGSLKVTVTTAHGPFVHSVYAPGERTGVRRQDAAREALNSFVAFIDGLPGRLDGELSDAEPYVPSRWLVELEPKYQRMAAPPPWPFAQPPVKGCATFPLDRDVDTATGVYRVTIDGRERMVSVKPALPFVVC